MPGRKRGKSPSPEGSTSNLPDDYDPDIPLHKSESFKRFAVKRTASLRALTPSTESIPSPPSTPTPPRSKRRKGSTTDDEKPITEVPPVRKRLETLFPPCTSRPPSRKSKRDPESDAPIMSKRRRESVCSDDEDEPIPTTLETPKISTGSDSRVNNPVVDEPPHSSMLVPPITFTPIVCGQTEYLKADSPSCQPVVTESPPLAIELFPMTSTPRLRDGSPASRPINPIVAELTQLATLETPKPSTPPDRRKKGYRRAGSPVSRPITPIVAELTQLATLETPKPSTQSDRRKKGYRRAGSPVPRPVTPIDTEGMLSSSRRIPTSRQAISNLTSVFEESASLSLTPSSPRLQIRHYSSSSDEEKTASPCSRVRRQERNTSLTKQLIPQDDTPPPLPRGKVSERKSRKERTPTPETPIPLVKSPRLPRKSSSSQIVASPLLESPPSSFQPIEPHTLSSNLSARTVEDNQLGSSASIGTIESSRPEDLSTEMPYASFEGYDLPQTASILPLTRSNSFPDFNGFPPESLATIQHPFSLPPSHQPFPQIMTTPHPQCQITDSFSQDIPQLPTIQDNQFPQLPSAPVEMTSVFSRELDVARPQDTPQLPTIQDHHFALVPSVSVEMTSVFSPELDVARPHDAPQLPTMQDNQFPLLPSTSVEMTSMFSRELDVACPQDAPQLPTVQDHHFALVPSASVEMTSVFSPELDVARPQDTPQLLTMQDNQFPILPPSASVQMISEFSRLDLARQSTHTTPFPSSDLSHPQVVDVPRPDRPQTPFQSLEFFQFPISPQEEPERPITPFQSSNQQPEASRQVTVPSPLDFSFIYNVHSSMPHYIPSKVDRSRHKIVPVGVGNIPSATAIADATSSEVDLCNIVGQMVIGNTPISSDPPARKTPERKLPRPSRSAPVLDLLSSSSGSSLSSDDSLASIAAWSKAHQDELSRSVSSHSSSEDITPFWKPMAVPALGSSPIDRRPMPSLSRHNFRHAKGFGTQAQQQQQQQQPFGQGQIFGASTGTSFGSAAPAFGQSTTPMFGSQQQAAPLFGSNTTPAFAAPTQNAFGSTALFGQPAQPQANTSLFGATPATSFGQPTKTSGYNFASTPNTLFGQSSQPQQQPQQTTIFQPTATSSNMFSSPGFGAQQTATGTIIKFTPVTGSDSMQKGGSTTLINTKHHSITCMKEYESKSFEELRNEDYSANRKGPQQNSGFGAAAQPFGATTPAAPLFGQPENKSTFGAATSFGQAPAFGQPSTSTGFGKPATSTFGTTMTTTSSFGFNQTPIFGAATTPAKPFGAQAAPLFGATQPQATNTFGSTNFFGQQQPATQQNTAFFKPTQPAFSTAPQTGSFAFGQTPASTTQTSTLFQPAKPSTGFALFNQNTPTTATAGNTFGYFNAFSKPAQSTFGQPTQQAPAFGSNISMPNTNLFGNIANKPSFGATTGTNLFSNTTMPTSNAFSLQPQQPIQQTLSMPQQLPSETQTIFKVPLPYGFTPHLGGVPVPQLKSFRTHYVTNPRELTGVLKTNEENAPLPKKIRMDLDDEENTKTLMGSYRHESNTNCTNTGLRNRSRRLILKDYYLHKPKPISLQGSPSDISNTSTSNNYPQLALGVLPKSLLNIGSNTVDSPTSTTPTSTKATSTGTSVETCDKATTIETDVPERVVKPKKCPITGIVCTRLEYYTIPELSKIKDFKTDEASCFIKGFTIGRVGYGNVYFPDNINVFNLNIDELVHFRNRELIIYPDDNNKPPLGEGLNRRAQVTLDGCFPKKGESDIDFLETLKSACMLTDTSFLDYRPETGSWVFTVTHFSKYGLSAADEQVCHDHAKKRCEQEALEKKLKEEEAARLKETIAAMEAKRAVGLGGIVEYDERDDDENYDEMDSYTIISVNDPVVDVNIDSPPQMPYREVSMMQMDSMRQLFFDNTYCLDRGDEGGHPRETIDWHTDVHKMLTLERELRTLERPIEAEVRKRSRLTRKHRKLCNPNGTIPLCRSMIPARGTYDIAAFKGRSFKVGWSKGFTMTTLMNRQEDSLHLPINRCNPVAFNKSVLLLMDVSNISIAELNDYYTPTDPFMKDIAYYMEIVLQESSVELQAGIPFFNVNHASRMVYRLVRQSNLCFNVSRQNKKLEYYKSIWNLIIALWGDADDNTSYTYRREQFNDWLVAATQDAMVRDLRTCSEFNLEENLKSMFFYLTGNQIGSASDLALRANAPNVGMLLALLNSSASARFALQCQIHKWNETSAVDHIDEDMMKLYLLISGVPFLNDVNTCAGLDWLRCLGIHFWYLTPSEQPLQYAVKLYEKAFSEINFAASPFPIQNNSKNTWDIIYHLLLLYSNNQTCLETVLTPETHTDDPTDYRFSWLLMQALVSLNVGLIGEPGKAHITTIFATQLEKLGLFKWAVFVLLFIPDMVIRKNLIMAVLDRNIGDGTSDRETERMIVNDLHIPKQWIHQVKAQKCNQLGQHWYAYRHLAYAHMWNECHDLLIRELTPTLVCNHHFELLHYAMKQLVQADTQIYRWKSRGGLLMEFIKYWERIINKPVDVDQHHMLAIYQEICKLILLMKSYPHQNDYKQVMIISEVSKFVSTIYHGVLRQVSTRATYLQSSAKQLKKLVMPSDYKYEDLNKSFSLAYTI